MRPSIYDIVDKYSKVPRFYLIKSSSDKSSQASNIFKCERCTYLVTAILSVVCVLSLLNHFAYFLLAIVSKVHFEDDEGSWR